MLTKDVEEHLALWGEQLPELVELCRSVCEVLFEPSDADVFGALDRLGQPSVVVQFPAALGFSSTEISASALGERKREREFPRNPSYHRIKCSLPEAATSVV